MKKFAIAVVAALVSASAFAAAGWVGAGVINVNGSWYHADEHWSTEGWAPNAFEGATIGTDLYNGTPLSLGGQLQLWDEGSADWGPGTTAYMYYKFDNAVEFTQTTLDYYRYDADQHNNFFQTGGEPMVSLSVDISGLADGDHTMSVYFGDFDGLQHTDTYTANFTTTSVPEPATMSLLGLGALAMVIRRKLRK